MQQPCTAAPESGHSSSEPNASPTAGPVISNVLPKQNEEYRAISVPTILWIVYITAVSGCIGGISLKGIFMQSNSGMSAHVSHLAYSLISPDSNSSIGSGGTFGIIASYAFGAFTSGVVLTAPASDGTLSLIKMSFPSVLQWTWRHQLLVTLCLCCLTLSHALVQDVTSSTAKMPSPLCDSCVASLMLLSYTTAILSTFVSLNTALSVRGSNHTNTIIDIFQKLGFALRARDCRYLWQVHLLFWAVSGYIAGVCIGSHAFVATFKNYSILVPIIMLCPLSIYGLFVLLWQLCHSFPLPRTAGLRRLTVVASTFASVSSTPAPSGEFVALHPRMYIWHLYNAFACGCVKPLSAPCFLVLCIKCQPLTHF